MDAQRGARSVPCRIRFAARCSCNGYATLSAIAQFRPRWRCHRCRRPGSSARLRRTSPASSRSRRKAKPRPLASASMCAFSAWVSPQISRMPAARLASARRVTRTLPSPLPMYAGSTARANSAHSVAWSRCTRPSPRISPPSTSTRTRAMVVSGSILHMARATGSGSSVSAWNTRERTCSGVMRLNARIKGRGIVGPDRAQQQHRRLRRR